MVLSDSARVCMAVPATIRSAIRPPIRVRLAAGCRPDTGPIPDPVVW
jgi:hypothetical protein